MKANYPPAVCHRPPCCLKLLERERGQSCPPPVVSTRTQRAWTQRPSVWQLRDNNRQKGELDAALHCRRSSRAWRLAAGLWLVVVLGLLSGRAATPVPIEWRPELIPFNLQSPDGVPISSVINEPPGSDGRVPAGQTESGSFNVATTNQFQGHISFGGIPAPTNWIAVSNSTILRGDTAFSGLVATEMQLPRATSNDVVVMVLRRGQIGAPYISRDISFGIGSVVQVPNTDERGVLLSGVTRESYWIPEPYSVNGKANTGYYWSPHAGKVFAIQAGPMSVTWRKRDPYTAATLPPDHVNPFGSERYETNGTSIYLLYTAQYVVSSSPARKPHKMYWTERGFRTTGRAVVVPAGRVGAVNVVYNNNFPRTVAEEYRGLGYTSPTEGSTNQTLSELRTLWYDQNLGSIYAYNTEGRVFVEFLGDARPDGLVREFLGFELVDVFRQPVAADLEVELGERVLPPARLDENLYPEPIRTSELPFLYRHTVVGSDRPELYASRETRTPNDCLVHWLAEGVAGIKWPAEYGRYRLTWPRDVAKFSHYLRPEVGTEAEARLTAVSLSTDNIPFIEYQDPLDRPRAKLTEQFEFFTQLDSAHATHRTLLRFTAGEHVAFERVFSWLDATIRTTNFHGTAAASLTAWNPTNGTVEWPDTFVAPRVVNEIARVGQRIEAPSGELGDEHYQAGYINQKRGILFDPLSYVDPFSATPEAASLGAIIPVNAVPGTNHLEVWWFRANHSGAGPNAGNMARGFRPIYWPTVLGRYALAWPEAPREIVLASKLGSGTLTSLESLGTIYSQNRPVQPGYNPNEEHAIMSGGTAYATRDDLNIVAGARYSSEPFVLVRFTAADARPAVSVFKVLREKPEAGHVFDYIVSAGQILQPPPPLTFLAKPVVGGGDDALNFNLEPDLGAGDLPVGWNEALHGQGAYRHYPRFTWRDRHHDDWVYRGLHAGLPDLRAGTFDREAGTFVTLSNATAVVGMPFAFTLHASRQDEHLALVSLNLPDWLGITGLTLHGTPAAVSTNLLTLVVRDLYDGSAVTNELRLAILDAGEVFTQGGLELLSTNSQTGTVVAFTTRPPFLAASPTPSNSFTMRYYYKTEPSFDWPGIGNPPPPGSIVPYLRPVNPETGQFVGDPASRETVALEVVYRPVWPVRDPKDSSKSVPTLPFGGTLTTPKFGLPGVRDMLTAQVLYQQSIAANLTNARTSAVLHDGTRQKFSDIEAQGLSEVPGGVRKDLYQGKYFFPNLVPHLATRVFFDPNRGAKGSLVLEGEYVRETLGESYLMLNVLRGTDLAAVKALCPAQDPDKAKWDALVDDLATDVETFRESPTQPGTYEPGPSPAHVGVGNLAVITSANSAVDSYALSATGPGAGYVTLVESSGTAFTKPGDPVAMHIFKVGGPELYTGEVKVIPAPNPLSEQLTFQHTADLAGRFDEFEYEWKIAAPVDGLPPIADDTMSRYLSLTSGTNLPRHTIGGAGLQALTDNYVVMRYRPQSTSHPLYNQWSAWTSPKLAEGWIKRVLAGINPFNQRVGDLFNNRANTDVSILTQAGRRWEGDVALNLESMNSYGLIEIYETVLRRGRQLSIEAGYNYGPANDALLLAAGYLNDLYMLLGGEAWADAANPTIGIGTKDRTYGDIATSLFAFKGQVASLLEEELSLLRGRDDVLQPGVQITPVYNRLVWNYTRGIDSGEVIYALNYDIQENPDQEPDGVVNAEDAARMFPQGHGDAYGHYLTALKGYYSLLMNSRFDWVPRIEAVNVLGQPVSVDYQDERKFAAAAAALARAGGQIFDLTWRKDYKPVQSEGWLHFAATRPNPQRRFVTVTGATNSVTRSWGLDHWASRSGQGAYINWLIGNAILPEVDPNPLHEGIQKIDRTTVPELQEMVSLADGLQTSMDNAESGLSPLGVPEGGLAFDINPSAVVGTEGGTHFEQVYQRARAALNNAVASFDDAKDVTRLMRSEQDSVADFQARVAEQEHAFNNALIELYGTPYPDDIGAGKTWKQGYTGPDLIHYAYVDIVESDFGGLLTPQEPRVFRVDTQQLKEDWFAKVASWDGDYQGVGWVNREQGITFELGSHGFFGKPAGWTGRRQSPGRLQQAASDWIKAHGRLAQALETAEGAKDDLDGAIAIFKAAEDTGDTIDYINLGLNIADEALSWAQFANEVYDKIKDSTKEDIQFATDSSEEALPGSMVVGVASGGDLTSAARSAIEMAGYSIVTTVEKADVIRFSIFKALETGINTARRWAEFGIGQLEGRVETQAMLAELGGLLAGLGDHFATINQRLREYEDAQRAFRTGVAQGDRLLEERHIFRQRASAVIQGFRTRDAAFRLFRNEKLERYKTLFDLAARYALLAANAYDYETGLLDTPTGRAFVSRIINARALGVVRNGEPQYAGSNTGDPGLSSVMAELKADWDVLRGRLGFNNPDAYGTTVSLRTELLRILPTSDGDSNWKDVLQGARIRNLIEDSDVRRYCMQIDNGDGLPVPGLIFTFSTTIADGYNLFGRELAGGDHTFSPSSFATKIFGVGVALDGYRGMDDPSANGGSTGGSSPPDPDVTHLDPLALSATPYIYLIPVGVDSMRSPPLGDAGGVRTWRVDDLAIPMPFNIGSSDFSSRALYQSADFLTEPLFAIRKHQAFRPVSKASVFSPSLYGINGTLQRSQFTNNRLVGRSVWNSQWKLVIPGRTLLNNPSEGLDRFVQTVSDIQLHFVTYSYSGN